MSTISASTTTTTAYKVAADTTGTLVFQTGATPTTAVTIDGSQNVGVGVTPSAWATSGTIIKAIQIGAAGSFAAGASDASTHVSQNAYFDGSSWRYIQSAAAGNYFVSGNSHNWRIAASGTAGNAITFTQAMTLDATGALTNSKSGTTGSACVPSATDAGFLGYVVNAQASRAASAQFDLYAGFANSVVQFRVRGDGVIYAQNTTVQSVSDIRFKENIIDSQEGLEIISALRPVRFDFKEGHGNDKKNQLGFIAQEIKQVFPDAVDIWDKSEDPENPYLSVGPAALIPVLVKAIQEQQALITQLQADVAALKGAA